ncbi:tRNA nucleotidyltransferase [Pseudoalteromonas sp. JBTF-M23]|uniref:tRNA nucleotidyltransferase n=1 Tax=Pseudoalteromonas caenipelagi TaxID=2726988 RepID=A0A849VKT3_9GAMM|nr:tRNA nucleotidyltransferase [Pseudoalteromonas caenipelagi]NOU52394.1 tRNA nucleotidyltransferase [Pseudoalteromonas caenipelagi]
MQVYLVGGAVRDELLNRPIIDEDYVVVGATIEQMLSLGYTQVGKDFPVFLHPKSKAEYALARTERKQGQGYGGFICDFSPDITLEQDLYRRDLTVNAIAKNENGQLVDPFNGQKDIANRILRHVGPAFSEDPLRILRVARFAARYHYLGFTIAPETRQLMAEMVRQGELATLTKERVWMEVEKCLSDGCIAIFCDVLEQIDALELVFPMFKTWTSSQSNSLTEKVSQLQKDSPNFKLVQFCLWLAPCQLEDLQNIEQTLKVPNTYAQCARDFCHYQSLLREETLCAESVLKLLNALDVWRRPARFEVFCQTALAHAPDQLARITKVRNSTQQAIEVDVQSIIAQGYKGAQIKEQLSQARLKALENAL